MNIERFAGDNKIFQQFSELMNTNNAQMLRDQANALQGAYEQRARDVAATGVKNPGSFL